MVELIITEKPSQSEKIAQALATGKVIKKVITKVPYYEIKHNNNKIIIGCAVGHLYNLTEKVKSFKYPSFDLIWKPSHEISKFSEFSKKYLNVLKKLAKQADKYTVATDFDQEGSLIGYNIVRFVCNQKDANRMKFSTLTKKELVDSYNNKSKHLDFPLIHSGETRHYLDYFYGINISRALMLAIKTTGAYKTLSSGRVQGPALKLLAEKELEIKKFIPKKYWQLEAVNSLTLLHEKDKIFDKKEADKIYTKVKNEKSAIIKSLTKKQFYQEPPNPFDLTSLQVEAYRLFGITPKNSLGLAQELYSHAYTSYPRTSSNQLPESINYKELLTNLSKQKKYEKLAKELLKNKSLKPNNGKKKDPAHPAIHFTGEIPKKLSDHAQKIYDLIVKRTLASFAEKAKRETMHIKADIKKEIFVTKGTRTIEKGWHEYYDPYVRQEEIELPKLKEKEKIKLKKINKLEKQTEPPRRYSEASIIKELEKRNLGTKCLTSNTLIKIKSNNKIHHVKIEELFNNLSDNSPLNEGGVRIAINNKKICFSFDEFNEIESNFKLVSKRKLNKNEKVYKVSYNDENFIELTENHPILIYNENTLKYIKTKNLKKGMKSASSIKIKDKMGKEIYSWNKFLKKCNKKSSLYSDFDIKKIRKNISQKKFAQKYGLKQSRISEYEKRKNIPIHLFKKLKLDKPTYLNSENKDLKIKNPFPLKESSSLARVLANCIGDGSIDKKKIKRENCYDFRYHNTNINLIEQFINDIYKLFNIKLEIKTSKKRENQLQRYFVKIPAVIGRILSIISKEIIEKNASSLIKKEFYPEFIGALFDDEGHCGNKEKKLFISNTNFKLLEDIKIMFDYLNIDSRINKKQFKIYVRKVKSLYLFFEKIPFTSTNKKQRLVNLLYKEELISKDFITKTISSIEKIDYGGYVYDITNNLENPNFILANGIVVHNSTRAAIVDALYQRDYVKEKSIEVTNLGLKNIEVLDKYVPEILDEKLTKYFEEELEKIIENKAKPKDILEESKKHLTKILEKFKKHEKAIGKELLESLRETQEKASIVGKCPKCKTNNLRILYSKRFKSYFIACAGYPKCKTTFSLTKGLPKPTDKKCPECGSPLVKIIRKGVRPFDYCFNKICPKRLKWIEENKKKVQEFKKQVQNQKSQK